MIQCKVFQFAMRASTHERLAARRWGGGGGEVWRGGTSILTRVNDSYLLKQLLLAEIYSNIYVINDTA